MTVLSDGACAGRVWRTPPSSRGLVFRRGGDQTGLPGPRRPGAARNAEGGCRRPPPGGRLSGRTARHPVPAQRDPVGELTSRRAADRCTTGRALRSRNPLNPAAIGAPHTGRRHVDAVDAAVPVGPGRPLAPTEVAVRQVAAPDLGRDDRLYRRPTNAESPVVIGRRLKSARFLPSGGSPCPCRNSASTDAHRRSTWNRRQTSGSAAAGAWSSGVWSRSRISGGFEEVGESCGETPRKPSTGYRATRGTVPTSDLRCERGAARPRPQGGGWQPEVRDCLPPGAGWGAP